MTMRKGQPLKLGATDADDTRYDYKNHVVANSDGTPRGGVTGPVGTAIVTSSATMNVSVAAFSAAAVRDGGVVLLANDGPTNVLLTSAPASNSRIDVIYAKQNDASATVTTPDANNTPVLDKATGTASATPAKPSIPTGAVELATVLVPSTATATNSAGVVITQTGQYTAAPGGVVPLRNATDQTGWAPADGGLAYRIDTKRLLQRVNGGWTWALSESWRARKGTGQGFSASTMTSVLQLTLPADAPAGLYKVRALPFTWSGSQTTHFRQVKWGSTTLDGNTTGLTVAGGIDFCFPGEWLQVHTGGSVVIDLSSQVNGGGPQSNAETLLMVDYIGPL